MAGSTLLSSSGSVQRSAPWGPAWSIQTASCSTLGSSWVSAALPHTFSMACRPAVTAYFGMDQVVRSYTAITAACMLVRRSVFEEMGGFDEAFPVAFNDVDFCIRLGQAGYRVLYTPHAELTHYESVSRGLSGYSADFGEFLHRWWGLLQHEDPYYNPNLTQGLPLVLIPRARGEPGVVCDNRGTRPARENGRARVIPTSPGLAE